jgi:hypothetical protein
MLSKSKKSEIRDPRTSHHHLRHGPRNSLAVGGHVYFANWLYYFLVALQWQTQQTLYLQFFWTKLNFFRFRIFLQL